MVHSISRFWLDTCCNTISFKSLTCSEFFQIQVSNINILLFTFLLQKLYFCIIIALQPWRLKQILIDYATFLLLKIDFNARCTQWFLSMPDLLSLLILPISLKSCQLFCISVFYILISFMIKFDLSSPCLVVKFLLKVMDIALSSGQRGGVLPFQIIFLTIRLKE